LRQPLPAAVAGGGGALRGRGAAPPAALALAPQGAEPHRGGRGRRAALPRPFLRPHPPRPRAGNGGERPAPPARSLAGPERRRPPPGGGAEPPGRLGATGAHALRPRSALLAGPARKPAAAADVPRGAARPGPLRAAFQHPAPAARRRRLGAHRPQGLPALRRPHPGGSGEGHVRRDAGDDGGGGGAPAPAAGVGDGAGL
ncbi:MAG: SAM-dependent methyltransferase 2, in cluster with Hydroxyacylglutathione hydrolase, partial [uncultured Acetobacteraceae bacterium]